MHEAMLEVVGAPDNPVDVAKGMDVGRFPRVADPAAAYAESEMYPFRAWFDVGLRAAVDGIERLAEDRPGRGTAPSAPPVLRDQRCP